MDSRSERVLLTGSGGFTGRPLAARLREDGHQVIGLTKGPAGKDELSGDLLNRDWVDRIVAETQPTVIIHLAAVSATQQPDAGAYSINVDGTSNLLDAASRLAQRPRRVIVASSAAVYAPPAGEQPITEDHPLEPRNAYGKSKHAMERRAGDFADRLPIVLTRPFNYTGPGQDPVNFVVPKIVDHFVRRAPSIKLGNLDVYRDLSDIRRVIEVYARLVSCPVDHPVVNICSGRTMQLRDIVDFLSEISGHSIEVIKDPALVRPGEPRTVLGSVKRLQSVLGGLPNPDFHDTLRWMYAAEDGSA